jgi:riboflavin kinase/FMN adenylyltransferase
MQFYGTRGAIPSDFGPSAVAVGKFDGLHLGHRAMFRRLLECARERGLVPAVLTFDRNPLATVRPEHAPPALVSPAQKSQLLEDAGIEAELMMTFTPEFAALTPEEFVTRILVDSMHAEVVVAGSDFRFGAKGAGDLATLRTLGERFGFDVIGVDDVLLDDPIGSENGTPRRVSSTWVRQLMTEGRVGEAAVLLGHPPAIRSTVVHGEQRGRELGYPTANLDPAIEGMLPADGVYAAWATVDGRRYGAAVSIGNNPTFDGIPQHQVEAHLLDQKLDLYGAAIELGFVERIRAMNKFDGVDALVAQLQQDEQRIRAVLSDATE